ncbi:hypothetical protein BAE44_0000648 [Dichanthelium oligosanthes]|uniref:Acyclic terpene utilisation N-terminal domain-containing protein n=1 Tax=Dichanthelium oligosanthes TaxID=888268 RepID=A0A1E5WLV0_9POAL|nr:hypothetical protein BAE44_0000648 [Dichanthelium oligosanthes]
MSEAVTMEEVQNCAVKLRSNPRRLRDKVYVGCGAGFGGDRLMAALKLLQRVKELNYLVLECLAERTLADRYRIMVSGGKGYDPQGMLLTSIPSYDTYYLPRAYVIISNYQFKHLFTCHVKEWMSVLLPLAFKQKVCIITNMGARSPLSSDESTGLRGVIY